MELKRNCELVICSLLKEALPDLTFLPSKGGGEDLTAVWTPDTDYKLKDVLRPTNPAFQYALVVTLDGNSGSSEPAFDDVPGHEFSSPGQPTYETLNLPSIKTQVDIGQPAPPFGVVRITEAEKTLESEETNRMEGVVVWVTHQADTNVVVHSDEFKLIYDAMTRITNGYDIMHRIMVHGLSVASTDEFTDESRNAHGDTVSFVLAASEV